METRMLGRLWPVSALTLGGGGVGQLWGPTTRDECIATVRTAVDCGITLLDMAPAYGNGEAESVVGAAFDGRLPAGIRVTTKHRLGTPPAGEVEGNIVRSLDQSLARMRFERVDLFFLHSNIIPDDYDASAYVDRPATRWTTYIERFIPICERLVADGRIDAWGITGIGIPECILAALGESSRPAAVQCITNPIDSPGELKYFAGPSRAREIIVASKSGGAGPMRSTGTCRRITASPRTSSAALLSARSPTSSACRRRRSPTATRCRCPASIRSCWAARTAKRFSNASPLLRLVRSIPLL
jgi:aryl-alcohol dehydrogenase-like predicted oxidoreductase